MVLQRSAEGDPQAVRALVRRYYPDLYDLAVTLSPDPEHAAVEAQRIMLHALLRMEEYHGETSFQLWLQRRAVTSLRGRRPDHELVLALTSLHGFSPEETAYLSGIEKEQLQALLRTGGVGEDEEPIPDEEAPAGEEQSQPGAPLLSSSRDAYRRAWTDEQLDMEAQEIASRFHERRLGRIFTSPSAWVGWSLLAVLVLLFLLLALADFGGPTSGGRASATQGGGTTTPGVFALRYVPQDGPSYAPALSADGNYVAFISQASNLAAGDTNQAADVFLYERTNGELQRLSVSADGAQADAGSDAPSLSADGNVLAFVSWARNLVPQESRSCPAHPFEGQVCAEVYLLDRKSNILERVPLPDELVEEAGHSGMLMENGALRGSTSLSADGRYLVFAAQWPQTDAEEAAALLFYDRQRRRTRRLELSFQDQPLLRLGAAPVISADGRFVAFQAYLPVPPGFPTITQVFRYDLQRDELSLISTALSGAPGNGSSRSPGISADGTQVVFSSSANDLLLGDQNGVEDIFLYDESLGEIVMLNASAQGLQTERPSQGPALSADGHFVAFFSLAADLVDGDINNTWDVFLLDRSQRLLELVSRAQNGLFGDSFSSTPVLSANGALAAFVSNASNLVPGDTNAASDVFLLERTTGALLRVSAARIETPPTARQTAEATPDSGAVLGTPTEVLTPETTPTLTSTPTILTPPAGTPTGEAYPPPLPSPTSGAYPPILATPTPFGSYP